MLKVTIQLCPYGSEYNKKDLSTVYIANVGGTNEFGNYDIWVNKDPRQLLRKPEAHAQVLNYPREQGAAVLTMKALQALEERKMIGC